MKKLLAATAVSALLGSAGLLLAGCASEHAVSLGPAPKASTGVAIAATTGTTRRGPASLAFEVWFVRRGKLVPVVRTHAATRRVATAALGELFAGPTEAQLAAGLTTAIPAGTRLLGISIARGVAHVDLTSEYESGGGSRAMQLRLAQVVYTLTQFPTVKAVRFALDGAAVDVFSSAGIVLDHPVGRSEYEALARSTTP